MDRIERARQVMDNVEANLAELDRLYIRAQMIAGAKHGFIIGLIVYANLLIWRLL